MQPPAATPAACALCFLSLLQATWAVLEEWGVPEAAALISTCPRLLCAHPQHNLRPKFEALGVGGEDAQRSGNQRPIRGLGVGCGAGPAAPAGPRRPKRAEEPSAAHSSPSCPPLAGDTLAELFLAQPSFCYTAADTLQVRQGGRALACSVLCRGARLHSLPPQRRTLADTRCPGATGLR